MGQTRSQPVFKFQSTGATGTSELLHQALDIVERQANFIEYLMGRLRQRESIEPAKTEIASSNKPVVGISCGISSCGSALNLTLKSRIVDILHHRKVHTLPRLVSLTGSSYEEVSRVINSLVYDGEVVRLSDRQDSRVMLAKHSQGMGRVIHN